MKSVSKEDARLVVEMSNHPGWAIFAGVILHDISVAQRQLEETKFEDLSEVAYLQGKITTLREVLDYPLRREAQLNKED